MDVSVIKKAEHRRIDTFELWCWRRLFRVPWMVRRSNQSILNEISPEYSLEGLIWSSNTLATWCKELTHWKRPWCWARLKSGGEGDDRGWDGWMDYCLDGHEFEQALGVGDGEGGQACCSPWGFKESDTTEQLNWTEDIKSEISAATWMDQELIILNEVSQTEKDKYHIISLIRGYKVWHKWTYLCNRNRPTDAENRLMVAKGAGSGGGLDSEFRISRYNYYLRDGQTTRYCCVAQGAVLNILW